MSGVFISHNHQDKSFVRRLGSDLAAYGVRVWIDEAEIKIGDSLITAVSTAIDEMDYFAIVLSPRSVASAWVQQELEQALISQIALKKIKVLPILFEDCVVPPFLRGKMYADFSKKIYEVELELILKTIGIQRGSGGLLFDPLSKEFGRHQFTYSRPIKWYCIFCGWKCDQSYNDYICGSCHQLRVFMGGSSTIRVCNSCKQRSLAVAHFCEWCGIAFRANDTFDHAIY